MLKVLKFLVMAVAALAEKAFLADLRPPHDQNVIFVSARSPVRKAR